MGGSKELPKEQVSAIAFLNLGGNLNNERQQELPKEQVYAIASQNNKGTAIITSISPLYSAAQKRHHHSTRGLGGCITDPGKS